MKWFTLLSAFISCFVYADAELRLNDLSAPTPSEITGARIISTEELREALKAPLETRPLLFDVIGDDGHMSLPGAIWLPGAGRGTSFDDEVQAQLAKLLEFATRDHRERQLVFFCAGPNCWLSYNAALRAAKLGYSGVRWYRGGIEGWRAAGGELARPRIVWKRS